jgi:hypothetical protein
MKKILFLSLLLSSVIALNARAQNTTSPQNNSAANPNPNRQTTLMGVFSNAAAAAENAFSNRFRLTNGVAGQNVNTNGVIVESPARVQERTQQANAELAQAESLLSDLQANIEQALPVLHSLTSGIATEANGVAAPNAQNSQTAPNAVISRRAVPGVVGTQNSGEANQTAGRILQRQTPSGVHEYFGMVGTNAFGMNPRTFQMLVILRNDLQNALPVLQSLNGSVARTTTPAGTVARNQRTPATSFTNLFLFITNAINGRLAPTGR